MILMHVFPVACARYADAKSLIERMAQGDGAAPVGTIWDTTSAGEDAAAAGNEGGASGSAEAAAAAAAATAAGTGADAAQEGVSE